MLGVKAGKLGELIHFWILLRILPESGWIKMIELLWLDQIWIDFISSSAHKIGMLHSHHLRTHWSERNLLEPFVAHANLSSFYKHDLENFRIPSKQQQVLWGKARTHVSSIVQLLLRQSWIRDETTITTWSQHGMRSISIHCRCLCRWSNYSDFTRSHSVAEVSWGREITLIISDKSRLVKYFKLVPKQGMNS